MDRALLKLSIQEWHELFIRASATLTKRLAEPQQPTLDFAVALTGIRRCGKTHLAFQMSQKIPSDQVLYYNFEDPLFFTSNKLENLDLLLSVAQEFRSSKISRLILDEIHVVDGWERWLRKLIDQKKYEIIVTGSSAKLLSSELATSLTGRALEYKVWPLSFSEILEFRSLKLHSQNQQLSTLREMFMWGGLPEVVKSEIEYKKRLLQQYLSDILLKDVIARNEIRNKLALDQILTFYLTNLSSLHSYNSVAKAFEFDTSTAIQYTRMLTEAFLIFEVHRYHANLKTQSRDPKKIYIGDLGFRTVGARSIQDDTGKLLENLVYLELRRRNLDVYYFKQAHEADFVIVDKYKPIQVLQVCSSDMHNQKTWQREIAGLLEALEVLDLSSGIIISHTRAENFKLRNRTIQVVPACEWLIGDL